MAKITLETYIDFCDSHKEMNLTNKFLIQIISMHGFKKFIANKKSLTEAVDSIELVKIPRSTLNENGISSSSSSCAYINLEELKEDMNGIDWKECCITSIQTLNYSSSSDSKSNAQSDGGGYATAKRGSSKSKKRKRSATVTAGVGELGGSSSYNSGPVSFASC